MFNLRKIIIVLVIGMTCQVAYADFASEYIERTRIITDINLQHSMMQDQVNALHNQNTYYPVPAKSSENDADRYNTPTYVIEKPLYKFGEVNHEN